MTGEEWSIRMPQRSLLIYDGGLNEERFYICDKNHRLLQLHPLMVGESLLDSEAREPGTGIYYDYTIETDDGTLESPTLSYLILSTIVLQQ